MRKPLIHKAKQQGQAIVLIAILMVALVAALGLAIDGGGMYLLYRDVQNATDSAGLSAAFALCSGGDYEEAAEAALALNGFVHGADGVTVNIINPPPVGTTYAGNDDYVFIELIAPKPSYFIQVVYGGPLEVAGATISNCDPGSEFGWPDNSAIVSLSLNCAASSGGAQTASNRATGGASYITVNGGIYNNGICSKGSLDTVGGSSITAGGYGVCAQDDINGNVTTSEGGDLMTDTSTPSCDVPQITETDPYVASGLATPTCTGPTGLSLSPGTNQPGTYTSFDTNGGTYILEPGIYCITDSSVSWKARLENDPTAGGVFLFFDGTDNVKSNGGNPDLDLHAITDEDSDYTNLLMWFHDPGTPPSNSTDVTFTANSTGDLTGTIYAPRKHCNLAGQAGTEIHAQIICYSFDANGGSGIIIYFDPSQIYEVPPSFGIAE